MKRVCVVDVYISTYQYVPVYTSMYLRYLNFDFFEIRPHPSRSLALELYAVAVYFRRAVLVYEKHSCLVNCIYLYIWNPDPLPECDILCIYMYMHV